MSCHCDDYAEVRKQALQEAYDIIFKDKDLFFNTYIKFVEFVVSEGVTTKPQ